MDQKQAVKVAVNGYGVIGKRVADAVARQSDMSLVGVCDIEADWRPRVAVSRGYKVFAATPADSDRMQAAGTTVSGTLPDLLSGSDVVVDCTPKKIASKNVEEYRRRGIKFVLQGGEKHEATGHSFVAESSYAGAFGRDCTRVVSCNTTSIVRTLTALKRAGLLLRARGTLLRRATDPWESDRGGIMNTLVPEPSIPSHQGPDAQTVDSALDVITMAVKVPETLSHLHYWSVQMTGRAERDEVLAAFRASSRLLLVRTTDGLGAINSIKEWMLDLGRPHGDLYEVALWEDMLTVQGDELFYAYMVDNQAIVIPETIDAIRALSGVEADAVASMARTNAALGIGTIVTTPADSERSVGRGAG